MRRCGLSHSLVILQHPAFLADELRHPNGEGVGPLAGAAAYFLDMADLIDNPDDEEQRALVDQLFVDN